MAKKNDEKLKKSIEFHYKKDSSYQVHHVDGCFGGVTPNGSIYVEPFVERNPTPRLTQHEVDEKGNLSSPKYKESIDGVVRHIECGLIMDVQTAEAVCALLKNQISQYKKMTEKGNAKK